MNNAQFPWNLFKQKDNFDFNHRTSTEILNKISFEKKMNQISLYIGNGHFVSIFMSSG